MEQLGDANFHDEVDYSDDLFLIEFYAPWCATRALLCMQSLLWLVLSRGVSKCYGALSITSTRVPPAWQCICSTILLSLVERGLHTVPFDNCFANVRARPGRSKGLCARAGAATARR